ncbi:hypothetical protein ES705_27444 [subsurface metagenome]
MKILTKGTKEWAESNVNFSKGCANGCLYCYARRMGSRFGWKPTEDWINMENKVWMSEKKFHKRVGRIMSPSSHDITTANVDLGIKVFMNILSAGNKLLIVTKPNPAVVEKICNQLNKWKSQILFRFTIGTLNDEVRAYWEPYASTIQERLDTTKSLYNNGWATSVSVEPFLDETVIKLVEELLPYVSDTIWVGPMNKIHVPKELWTKELSQLYSSTSLKKKYGKLQKLGNSKIRFKDHFISIMNKDNFITKTCVEIKVN